MDNRASLKRFLLDSSLKTDKSSLPISIRRYAQTGNKDKTFKFFEKLAKHLGKNLTRKQLFRLKGISRVIQYYDVDKLLDIFNQIVANKPLTFFDE